MVESRDMEIEPKVSIAGVKVLGRKVDGKKVLGMNVLGKKVVGKKVKIKNMTDAISARMARIIAARTAEITPPTTKAARARAARITPVATIAKVIIAGVKVLGRKVEKKNIPDNITVVDNPNKSEIDRVDMVGLPVVSKVIPV